jgi:hypothetical protein
VGGLGCDWGGWTGGVTGLGWCAGLGWVSAGWGDGRIKIYNIFFYIFLSVFNIFFCMYFFSLVVGLVIKNN